MREDRYGDAIVDIGKAIIDFGNTLKDIGLRMQVEFANRQRAQRPTPILATVHSQIEALALQAGTRLTQDGYLRLHDIIGRRGAKDRPAIPPVIPVSSSTWYAGIKAGRFPAPIKIGATSVWRAADIRELVQRLEIA